MSATILAMTDVGFVSAAYVIMLVGLAAYAVRVLRMGRRLSRDVPADRRRWGQ